MGILLAAMVPSIANPWSPPYGPAVIRHPNAAGAATSRVVDVMPAGTIIFVSGETPIPADLESNSIRLDRGIPTGRIL